MSFAEKIKQSWAKNAAIRQAAAIVEKAERQQDREKSRQWRIKEAQEAAKEAAFKTELNNLLKVAGARELLKEMRQVVGGKIDKKPFEFPDGIRFKSYYPELFQHLEGVRGIGLALRYRYRDVEVGEGYYGNELAYWSRREAALYVLVGFGNERSPFVTTVYGFYRAEDSSERGNLFSLGKGQDGNAKEGQVCCISKSIPEVISPEDPENSRHILEEQLFGISGKDSFQDLEHQARLRIIRNYELPGRARLSVSPVLHERVLAKIPVANLFLR